MNVLLKGVVSASIIVALSELAKRHPVLSGLIAAMPLTTLLVILWIYVESKDVAQIQAFSTAVLWALIPTSLFFIALVVVLKRSASFGIAMAVASALWLVGAVVHMRVLGR